MVARVGVLALQGDFREHKQAFVAAGASVQEVRTIKDLEGIDALAIPGGESTVMSKLLASSGLDAEIAKLLDDGMPAFGTCAGMILLASDVIDGIEGQRRFGVVDITVRRNGIGNQSASNETDIAVVGSSELFPAVFIRPPVVEEVGDKVEVLAEVNGKPVLCRQDNTLVASFHPEISGDNRIHKLFLTSL